MMMDLTTVLREALGWLSLLPLLAAVVVCSLHLGRSRWAGVLLAGFAGETAIMAFYRITALFMTRGLMSYSSLAMLYLAASVFGIVASGVVVVGIWGLLNERASAAPRTL
jgi:hypothetical protein